MWLLNNIEWSLDAINEQAWTIFIVGISTVFFALYVLSVTFILFQKFLAFTAKKNQAIKEKKEAKNNVHSVESPIVEKLEKTDSVYVAIAMALHLFTNEQHDDESLVLTIDGKERLASPWASKTMNIFQKN